jgi:hypothetical protein
VKPLDPRIAHAYAVFRECEAAYDLAEIDLRDARNRREQTSADCARAADALMELIKEAHDAGPDGTS